MSGGYDFVEMVQRYFYVHSNDPLMGMCFKLGAGLFLFALFSLAVRRD
jgi:hypothetical protein